MAALFESHLAALEADAGHETEAAATFTEALQLIGRVTLGSDIGDYVLVGDAYRQIAKGSKALSADACRRNLAIWTQWRNSHARSRFSEARWEEASRLAAAPTP